MFEGASTTCALHVVATHRQKPALNSAERGAFVKAHPDEAKAAYEKELARRERKAAKGGAEEGEAPEQVEDEGD